MREIPVHYDDELGWIADVPSALPEHALRALADYVYTVNFQRVRGMPRGETRDRMQRRLVELRTSGIQQRVHSRNGIGLFESKRAAERTLISTGN